MASPTRVAVVGGGIAGLVATRKLVRSGLNVSLLEESDRLGGKIATEAVDDVEIDAGPDSFLARDPAAVELCRDLGLGDQLVSPAVFGAYVWLGRDLRKVPAGFPYGLPVAPAAAWRTGVLTARGAARAAADLVLPNRLSDSDVSIGEFVRSRFGDEALERLVDPLLAGTRAGRADDISLRAATPQIDALARSDRSVIRAVRRERRRGRLESGPPPFLAVKGGIVRVVDRLQDELEGKADVHAGRRVTRVGVERGRYRLETTDGSIVSDAVILAVPAFVAANLLEEALPDAAALLARVEYASVAVATLVFPPRSFAPPRGGSGFLVPSGAGRTVAACTWYSTKWPHAAPVDGRQIVRAFVGRAAGDGALAASDDELIARVAGELHDAMGFAEPPVARALTRWERALPQYAVGHAERMDEIEALLPPAMAVAGAGYRGSGLPDCIRQAQQAAAHIRATLEP
ncbi:MAG: protoporphyrinogen oxidase [Actinomycetota bacterium]